jgi:hypothetical protein
MKRFAIVVLIAFVSFVSLTSCATSPAGTADGASVAPKPSSASVAVLIEFARASARIGLSITLQKKGVSPEDTAEILAELHSLADDILAGKDVRAILSDPARWAPLRVELVKQLGAIIAKAKVSGVAIYDTKSAESFASSVIDAFASAVRPRA